jgi:hypothetical protein
MPVRGDFPRPSILCLRGFSYSKNESDVMGEALRINREARGISAGFTGDFNFL